MNTKSKKNSFIKKALRFLWKIFLWFNILSIAIVVIYKFIPVPFTPLMAIRYIEQSKNKEKTTYSHQWVAIENISPHLQKAVIASEDALFLEHYGFDIKSMKKAYDGNKKGKRIKGGSTISQQTAKNVFLWPGRSYIRKIFEAYYTLLIEIIWGKERILEVYLNSIEMGNGTYGAQAASQKWYKKQANNLSVKEAAGIAAILPNPRKYNPVNSSGYINRRKSKIARHLQHVKLEF